MEPEHVRHVAVARKANRDRKLRERIGLGERKQDGPQPELRTVFVKRTARELPENTRKVECAGPDVARELIESEAFVRERVRKMLPSRFDEFSTTSKCAAR